MHSHTHDHEPSKSDTDDSNDVDTYVRRYEPQTLTGSHWEAWGEQVRECVRATGPETERRAKERLTSLCWFAAMLLEQGILTPTGDLAALIDQLMVMDQVTRPEWDVTQGTRGSYRRSLRIIGRAVNPKGWPAVIQHPRRGLQPPVGDEDIESWLHTATVWGGLWGPRLEVAVALPLAAATAPEDLRALRSDDITVDGDRVTVSLTGLEPRTVPINDEWAAHVADLKDRIDGYLLTGNDTAPTQNALHRLGDMTKAECHTRLNIARMRTTCLVGWVLDDLPVDVFRYRAGLKTLRSVNMLLEYIDRDPSDWMPPTTAVLSDEASALRARDVA